MIVPVTVAVAVPILNDLPTEMLSHVLDFLDDTDLAEAVHVGHALYPRIRNYLLRSRRNPFHTVCHGCYHPPPHCHCRAKSRCVGWTYFLFLIGLILFCALYPMLQYKKA